MGRRVVLNSVIQNFLFIIEYNKLPQTRLEQELERLERSGF